MKSRFTFCLLILAVVLLAACGGRTEETTLTSTSATSATDATADTTIADATHPASPGGTAVVPSVGSGTTVVVMVEDGRVAVRGEAIPPGPAVFTVTNGGEQLHNLHIEGPGVSAAAGDPIPAKSSRDVNVTLQAGTYTLYCPVLDHRTKGEETTLTIAAP